jgi:peptidoglycan/xylan/chitin deacetylase (PgdA/CDA1 family)
MRQARAAVKVALGRAAGIPPAARRLSDSLSGSANIVYAHYVGPSRPYLDAFYYGTDARWLDETLGELSRAFSFVPLSEVVAGTASGRNGRPPLAVSFDDGFDMSSGDVPEILARHGVSATVFAITSCIGNGQLMWRNKLSATAALTAPERLEEAYGELAAEHGLATGPVLDASRDWPMADKDDLADELWRRCDMPPLEQYLAAERPYFTWDGLRGWLAAGHEVGLHTHTHPRCDRLDAAAIEREIRLPAAQLRRELGLDGVALSYPFGLRLPAQVEAGLIAEGVVTCALGIRGFSQLGTPPQALERATLEQHMRWEVFGRPLVRSLRPRR